MNHSDLLLVAIGIAVCVFLLLYFSELPEMILRAIYRLQGVDYRPPERRRGLWTEEERDEFRRNLIAED